MNSAGKMGEEFAAAELERQGYRVLDANFHSRYGEIDLIAVRDEIICFVEVKTRKRGSMVGAGQSVTKTKQRKIIQTALIYMQENDCPHQPRFDVFAAVTGPDGQVEEFDYLEGAFDSGAYQTGY